MKRPLIINILRAFLITRIVFIVIFLIVFMLMNNMHFSGETLQLFKEKFIFKLSYVGFIGSGVYYTVSFVKLVILGSLVFFVNKKNFIVYTALLSLELSISLIFFWLTFAFIWPVVYLLLFINQQVRVYFLKNINS